jgi:hypothetical protein
MAHQSADNTSLLQRDRNVFPLDREELFFSIWDLDITDQLQELSGATVVLLDQCRFLQDAQQGTFIMASTDVAA